MVEDKYTHSDTLFFNNKENSGMEKIG